MKNFVQTKKSIGLYNSKFEHDNCGIGAVVDIYGRKTHQTVSDALTIVEKLEHRAGKDAAGETGDGVGILLQISHDFFSDACKKLEINIGDERDYGVGMFFFPQDDNETSQAMRLFEVIVKKENLEFLGWRKVPTNEEILGKQALDCMPSIWQCFIKKPSEINSGIDFDRRLYVVRRMFEQGQVNQTYVCSLSSRTIVYKGMFLVGQLRGFYKDLQDENYTSAMGLVHSRFSTNTMPSWMRAHPNRFILHNGEINTIKGNADLMLAREETVSSKYLENDIKKVMPIINRDGSDSAMLDNALEFMVMNGMELPLSVMATIPEPWANDNSMSSSKKDFYQYYATMLEPWDGPAAILFSDGDVMGAVLDRNGLRPSRYYITKDGRMILSSEVGVIDLEEGDVEVKERLRPGKMLLVDMVKGKLIDDNDVKEKYATSQPYGEWLDSNLVSLEDLKIPNQNTPTYTKSKLVTLQKAFGYKYEEVNEAILSMAIKGAEPHGAMGNDTPLAVLSKENQPLFNYFKQMFAQVTNPPIDAIREKIVTDTCIYIGSKGNLVEESPNNCRVLKVKNPILTQTDILKIKTLNKPGLKVAVVSILYYKNTSLQEALENLFVEVDKAYHQGANIVVLSDRGVDECHVAIPSLLAVAATSKHLVRTKKRSALSIILESAEPRDVHHFATLLGYGASAINPYLVHESIRDLQQSGLLEKDYYAAVEDYNKSVLDGIIKIASKMGISTIQSYQGSQIFECIGISDEVVSRYFTGTPSRVGGISLKHIQQDVETNHKIAFDPLGLDTFAGLESGGALKMRSGKEQHLYNPSTIHLLQQSVQTGNYELFKEYETKLFENDNLYHLRNLLDFNYPTDGGIPLEKVESAREIVKRFSTGPMSYGSLSKEAHETLAIAMNNLGAKSNTGEGGEDESRHVISGDGLDRNSAVKQVASARFGVTSKYLVSAKEIQIKVAQGAKPGEGGHLPGTKVYPWVAKTRYSTTGVGLISPPPHHDIYSIEDLAQLIYDLKSANRDAGISVKLVSEAGVGTIAAGVAKAGAGHITISGYDGGTGSAPTASIHHAGLPFELGVAETHQTLIMNGLRSRIQLETDSKIMSGREIAIAAMLGAERFSFATGPLVALGCVMMRVCNLDTCPMGIATQNPKLRERFIGKVEYVENFMLFMAESLRHHMAKLGVATIEELVGRTDLLKKRSDIDNERANAVDVSALLSNPLIKDTNVYYKKGDDYDFELESTLDLKEILPKFKKSLESKKPATMEANVINLDRSTGTIFGSEITKLYGNTLEEDMYKVVCTGSGGQSFGAFIPKGLTLELIGDCNDYIGKGLSGGNIIVYPGSKETFKRDENIVIGNVALYGATSGNMFASGVAGERFAVRNSGAIAVVEGVGDHGCEYMTGGTVVVLGNTGKNFAAGMSGGIAYVLDENFDFYKRVNKDMVSILPVKDKVDVDTLKSLITKHAIKTGSVKAKEILNDYEAYLPKFKKVYPHDYDKMVRLISKMEAKGLDNEQAQIEAFYAIKNGK